MLIYGALLIPLATVIVLLVFFKRQTLWWEFVIPVAASALFICVMKFSVEAAQVRSEEYWGSSTYHITRVEGEVDKYIDGNSEIELSVTNGDIVIFYLYPSEIVENN